MDDLEKRGSEVIQEKEELQEMLWRGRLDLLEDPASLVLREPMDSRVCRVSLGWLV